MAKALQESCLLQKQAMRGGNLVSAVIITENESFETALKRFNRKIQQDGILSEARRREHYEKPSVKRKRKEAARRRKVTHKR
jgi:small subunit ribosomal protein S21